MDTQGLVITTHAHEQFVTRYNLVNGHIPRDSTKSLNKLLRQAKRDRINAFAAINRLKRHGQEAEYYSTKCGWRFVTVQNEEGKRVLVTVERISRLQNITQKEDI
jgi:hypothetical protein